MDCVSTGRNSRRISLADNGTYIEVTKGELDSDVFVSNLLTAGEPLAFLGSSELAMSLASVLGEQAGDHPACTDSQGCSTAAGRQGWREVAADVVPAKAGTYHPCAHCYDNAKTSLRAVWVPAFVETTGGASSPSTTAPTLPTRGRDQTHLAQLFFSPDISGPNNSQLSPLKRII